MERDVAVSLVTGRMVSSAMRFARELGLTGPVVGYQGGLIRAMPDARLAGGWASSCCTRRSRPTWPARSSQWTREHGLDPHVNHLERFILRADDPRADDYSAFMGCAGRARPRPARGRSRTRSRRSSRSASRRIPIEAAPIARAHFAGRADVTISPPALPRVRRAGRFEGPGRALAGPAAAHPARRRPWPSATSGTTSRCSPRSATARRCRARRPRSGPWPATSRRRSRTRAPAQIIEQLVLASPARGPRRLAAGSPPRPTSARRRSA